MNPSEPSADDRRPGLKPPQYGLGTLFVFLTIVCCLLVTAREVGPLGGSALLLLVLAVFAHVAGNAIGTRLRANGDAQIDRAGRAMLRRDQRHFPMPCVPFAPATQLSVRKALGRSMLVLTGVGAIVGATSGAWLLGSVNWERATVANMAIGTVSFAVLGGLWGFWASSFFHVFWDALAQAHRESKD
jgi:hypothetical protein